MSVLNLKAKNKMELVIVAAIMTCGMLLAPRMTLTGLICYKLGSLDKTNPAPQEENGSEEAETKQEDA